MDGSRITEKSCGTRRANNNASQGHHPYQHYNLTHTHGPILIASKIIPAKAAVYNERKQVIQDLKTKNTICALCHTNGPLPLWQSQLEESSQ